MKKYRETLGIEEVKISRKIVEGLGGKLGHSTFFWFMIEKGKL